MICEKKHRYAKKYESLPDAQDDRNGGRHICAGCAFKAGKRDFKDIEQYMECQAAYYRNFNDHGRLLRLRRLYHAIFFGGKDKCSELQKAGPSLA